MALLSPHHQKNVALSLLTLGTLPGKSFLQIQKLVKFKGESVIPLCHHPICHLNAKDKQDRKEQVYRQSQVQVLPLGKKKNTPMPFSTELPEYPTKRRERKGTFSHFRLLLQLAKQSLVLESQN